MKSTKLSLLNKNPILQAYPEQIVIDESSRQLARHQEEISYTALKESEIPQIERKYLNLACHRQNTQTSFENKSNVQPSRQWEKSRTDSKMPAFQMRSQMPAMIYNTSLQHRGSMIQANHPAISVMNLAPYVPPVETECSKCQCKQHVPGDAEQFYCGKCSQLNDLQPRFGFFRCGVCRQKVCYPFHTSDHIQCNICYSVNLVPQASSSSQVRLSSLNQSQMLLPKDLSEDAGETASLEAKEKDQSQP